MRAPAAVRWRAAWTRSATSKQMWCMPPAGCSARNFATGELSPSGVISSSLVLSRVTKTTVTPCSGSACGSPTSAPRKSRYFRAAAARSGTAMATWLRRPIIDCNTLVSSVAQLSFDAVEDCSGGVEDVGAGAEDFGDASGAQEAVVFGRDDAADHDGDLAEAARFELGDQFWNESLVAGGERADADGIDVQCRDVRGNLRGGLEQIAHVDREAEI